MAHAKAPRLLTLAAALCALLVLPAAASAAGTTKYKGFAQCANADVTPDAGNLAAVEAAVLCLHNRERSARGLAPLKENRKLREAAEEHSAAMVSLPFFAHDAPDGTDMVDRLLGAGYAGRSLGENIAWGTGDLATAAQIHRAWMRSPGHKANIVGRRYREIGIGIAIGAPVDTNGLDGATYTADFGVRR